MALSGQIGIDMLLMENPGNVKGFFSTPLGRFASYSGYPAGILVDPATCRGKWNVEFRGIPGTVY